MSALALSCLIFVLTLSGILLGALLRRALHKHHLSKDSQDVVRLGVGLIATLAALLLGLLIAAAKSSFDTQSTQVTQITAEAGAKSTQSLLAELKKANNNGRVPADNSFAASKSLKSFTSYPIWRTRARRRRCAAFY
jgi:fluoride ion exporter CrcB/FEX